MSQPVHIQRTGSCTTETCGPQSIADRAENRLPAADRSQVRKEIVSDQTFASWREQKVGEINKNLAILRSDKAHMPSGGSWQQYDEQYRRLHNEFKPYLNTPEPTLPQAQAMTRILSDMDKLLSRYVRERGDSTKSVAVIPEAAIHSQTVSQKPVENLSSETKAATISQSRDIKSLRLAISEDYEKTLRADAKLYGGTLEWLNSNQEYVQSYMELRSLEKTGGTESQRLLQLERMEKAIRCYRDVREDLVPKSPPKDPEKGLASLSERELKLPWPELARETFTKLNEIWKGEVYQRGLANKDESVLRFNATYERFRELYENRGSHDSEFNATLVREMARMVKSWEPTFTQSGGAEPPSLFASFVGIGTQIGIGAFTSPEPILSREQILKSIFSPNLDSFELRERLIASAGSQKFPEINAGQLEALITLKAKFERVAGPVLSGERSPTFNRADVEALSKALTQYALENPAEELYGSILKSQNIDPNSKDARGVRIALGMESLSSEESAKLNKGMRLERRPLGRFLLEATGNYPKLQEGKRGVQEINQAKRRIPGEVRANVESELKEGFDSGRLLDANTIDATPRQVTPKQIREVQQALGVLGSIGAGELAEVERVSGKQIDSVMPNGMSLAAIEWMLAASNTPQGKTGLVPGSVFIVKNKPE